jgi:hypothetical protein
VVCGTLKKIPKTQLFFTVALLKNKIPAQSSFFPVGLPEFVSVCRNFFPNQREKEIESEGFYIFLPDSPRGHQ